MSEIEQFQVIFDGTDAAEELLSPEEQKLLYEYDQTKIALLREAWIKSNNVLPEEVIDSITEEAFKFVPGSDEAINHWINIVDILSEYKPI